MGIQTLYNHQDKLDLTRSAGKCGMNLSGGQKQIVYLLRCLLSPSKPIIIFDEPTSALDEKTKMEVLHLIQQLSKNKTTIIISHDPNMNKYGLIDRFVYVHKGKISKQ